MSALLPPATRSPLATATARDLPQRSCSRPRSVLPFRNVGLEPENEYFCEGLAEELITALTKIEDVRVAARTSTFTFKGKDVDLREIGERLKVNAVLDGSVRASGDRVRVSCQLLNTQDGYEMWSEQYDRKLDDVFSSGRNYAGDSRQAEGLARRAPSTPSADRESRRISALPEGRFYWSKRYEGGLKTAMEEFQAAIGESAYAPSYRVSRTR
jgi:TolB-like protein